MRPILFHPAQPDDLSKHLVFSVKIRCPLYDSIALTELERKVIDRPEFQRLRRIRQTGFVSYAYPGATHTRFEHSLGVMHVASVMFPKILAQQVRLIEEKKKNDEELLPKFPESDVWEKTAELIKTVIDEPGFFQLLRLAALCHDLGHGPMSHTTEKMMPTWAEFIREIEKEDIDPAILSVLLKRFSQEKTEEKVKHEAYTMLLISKIFSAKISDLNVKLCLDIFSVLDLKISPSSEGLLFKNKAIASFLHEIISGEIDADRMDYILRDSFHAGVTYGFFDLGRLIDSLGIYWDKDKESFHLALRKSGVTAYEDYLQARFSLHQQVYFHKTPAACEAMFLSMVQEYREIKLPINSEKYQSIDDNNFPMFLLQNGVKKEFVDDLFYLRNLWKKVFEESWVDAILKDKESSTPSAEDLLDLLREKGIQSILLESEKPLTQMNQQLDFNLDSSGKSKYFYPLKVIVKNNRGIRCFESIHNHSQLLRRHNNETGIRRIFVAQRNKNGNLNDIKEIRRLIQHVFGLGS